MIHTHISKSLTCLLHLPYTLMSNSKPQTLLVHKRIYPVSPLVKNPNTYHQMNISLMFHSPCDLMWIQSNRLSHPYSLTFYIGYPSHHLRQTYAVAIRYVPFIHDITNYWILLPSYQHHLDRSRAHFKWIKEHKHTRWAWKLSPFLLRIQERCAIKDKSIRLH